MGEDRPTVLVVEDDRATQEVLQEVLTEAGYDVALAPDGATALAQAQTGQVDLVLLDRGLPDMDGLEICRQLCAQDHSSSLPVIVLTWLGSAAQQAVGLAAGADDYLAKPPDINELVNRVHAQVHK